jgi:hypothetical protein
VEKTKLLPLPGFELRPALYRLRYPSDAVQDRSRIPAVSAPSAENSQVHEHRQKPQSLRVSDVGKAVPPSTGIEPVFTMVSARWSWPHVLRTCNCFLWGFRRILSAATAHEIKALRAEIEAIISYRAVVVVAR